MRDDTPGPDCEMEEGDDDGDGGPINNEHNGTGMPMPLVDEWDENVPEE